MHRGAVAAALLTLALAALGQAATPEKGTLKPDSKGKGKTEYTGSVRLGTETGQSDAGSLCFDVEGKPETATSGCDVYELKLDVPQGFYKQWVGGANVHIVGPDDGATDMDLYIYEKTADGTADFEKGAVASSTSPTADEQTVIPKGDGNYYVAVTPYAVPTGSADYKGTIQFVVEERIPPLELNKRAPAGFPNYRASHDKFTSHSEPTIAMDPLNPTHLMAGSKQYENNAKYLFKIGTYESFDGGRSWRDYGQLPGYCEEEGQCDPKDEERYRTTSDISIAYDDEGNAYGNVLDAPGGTFAFKGFNLTVHIKKPGKPWSQPIVVHDNRNNEITAEALLDDKNWIAVDNSTDVDGGENKPKDGKIGTVYVCWSFDDATVGVQQRIAVMRSLDGGQTWGGVTPGDNTPLPVSTRGLIDGIGCHILIDKDGVVTLTWYDTFLGSLMQAQSTDRGASFSPARPIALIEGNDNPFPGQAFRNLSIPTTGLDNKGNIYVAVSTRTNVGGNAPVPVRVQRAAEELIEEGKLDREMLKEMMFEAGAIPRSALDEGEGGEGGEEGEAEGGELGGREELADGEKKKCPDEAEEVPCSDILLFRSSDSGASYQPPVRVNQDPKESPADQFQPWLAVTPKGQVDVMYFDRRNDPANFYIDTYLSRSDDNGQHFYDTRVSQLMWDPEVNAPTSVSGAFIGDYQGLVADDKVAIPFWNDTQLANFAKKDPRYSPWQEVFAARVPNTVVSRIGKPKNGKRFKRGRGRKVRGTASPLGGQKVTKVHVALARRAGKRCRWYTGKRYTKKRSCKKPRWIKARGTKRWRYKIRRKALRKRGRYVLRSRATAGKIRESIFEPRRNQVKFRVR